MRRLVIRDQVIQDLQIAYERYAHVYPALGERFLNEWEDFCEHLSNYPNSAARYRDNIRQGRLSPFPYLIMYELYPEEVVIFAVIHNRQHPTRRTRTKK